MCNCRSYVVRRCVKERDRTAHDLTLKGRKYNYKAIEITQNGYECYYWFGQCFI
jgi:hypothetical protein